MAKRGRPRNDSVQNFSVHKTPEEGLYLVRFWADGEAFCAAVRYKVRMHKHTVETLSPLQTFREIAKKLSKYGLGASDEAVARRLNKMFRETVIIRNLNQPGN